MPGPNDYHIIDGEVLPGLGKDEPNDAQRAGMRSAGAAKIQLLKEELAAAGAELSEKERMLMIREQELEKREQAIAVAEVAAGKKKP